MNTIYHHTNKKNEDVLIDEILKHYKEGYLSLRLTNIQYFPDTGESIHNSIYFNGDDFLFNNLTRDLLWALSRIISDEKTYRRGEYLSFNSFPNLINEYPDEKHPAYSLYKELYGYVFSHVEYKRLIKGIQRILNKRKPNEGLHWREFIIFVYSVNNLIIPYICTNILKTFRPDKYEEMELYREFRIKISTFLFSIDDRVSDNIDSFDEFDLAIYSDVKNYFESSSREINKRLIQQNKNNPSFVESIIKECGSVESALQRDFEFDENGRSKIKKRNSFKIKACFDCYICNLNETFVNEGFFLKEELKLFHSLFYEFPKMFYEKLLENYLPKIYTICFTKALSKKNFDDYGNVAMIINYDCNDDGTKSLDLKTNTGYMKCQIDDILYKKDIDSKKTNFFELYPLNVTKDNRQKCFEFEGKQSKFTDIFYPENNDLRQKKINDLEKKIKESSLIKDIDYEKEEEIRPLFLIYNNQQNRADCLTDNEEGDVFIKVDMKHFGGIHYHNCDGELFKQLKPILHNISYTYSHNKSIAIKDEDGNVFDDF